MALRATFLKHHPHKGKSSTARLDFAIVYHHTSYHDEKLRLHKPTPISISTSLDAQLPWDKKQGTPVGRGTGCLAVKQHLRWQIPSRKQQLPRMDGKCSKFNQFLYKYYILCICLVQQIKEQRMCLRLEQNRAETKVYCQGTLDQGRFIDIRLLSEVWRISKVTKIRTNA